MEASASLTRSRLASAESVRTFGKFGPSLCDKYFVVHSARPSFWNRCNKPHRRAFEAFGAVPDIVTVGKPFGNGFPLSAVVTTREVSTNVGILQPRPPPSLSIPRPLGRSSLHTNLSYVPGRWQIRRARWNTSTRSVATPWRVLWASRSSPSSPKRGCRATPPS
jgi:hypothetical protein